MFIGHFGIAFSAKKATPTLPLWLLFFAVQFSDLLWPTLVLLNIERVSIVPGITKMAPLNFTYYPISHSLGMTLIWSVLIGLTYWFISKIQKNALVVGLCVVSHWVLDLLVHRPDLPLLPGHASLYVGFGLWNFPVIECVLEYALFLLGFIIYLRGTVAKNKFGKFGLWLFAALLVLTQVSNVIGSPPKSVAILAWSAQGIWLFILLAFWIDLNRVAISNN